ncbi:transcriptional regulator, AraC family [Opitutus terrae PB90-1]|uniref:Transcriptional regulator, AraC family n=2 Tax=Opitutus terrae TaxID=107709 RepID=B1ZPX6_OPITP|nr:transcriptional regulator, AraC family [Opitutus terrae PB90-1]
MAGSRLFQDYQRAFAAASGVLPILRDVQPGNLAARPIGRPNPPRTRTAHDDGSRATQTREWTGGFCETAVPVRAGNRVLALLCIGPVRVSAACIGDGARVARLTAAVHDSAVTERADDDRGRASCLARADYAAFVQLLEIFAGQLGDWHLRHAPGEMPRGPIALLRAKEWIAAHHHEPITLAGAATVAQMSTWTFSRSFHRAFGVMFRDFLSGVRIDHARKMLAHPDVTIADTLHAVGFASRAQFNRSFRKFAGTPPGKFRAALANRAPATGPGETFSFLAAPSLHAAAG